MSGLSNGLLFFFDEKYDLGSGPKPVHSLLQKIQKAKYPAITPEEEKASIPLQIVLQGIFDAALVNLMQTKGKATWQTLRRDICASLNSRKNVLIMDIMKKTYANADIIFLQEVGNQLVGLMKQQLANVYDIVVPKIYNTERNQNSVILLRRGMFEKSEEVAIPADGWEKGDLLVIKTKTSGGLPLTLASFHGDTNGLLTAPMLSKVHAHLPTARLLFGMDANTYEKPSKKTYHVLEFEKMYTQLGYKSHWGKVDPRQYTTFNARTYLQPQLNKASKSTDLAAQGDRNPKDFILFTEHFALGRTYRDNTGKGEYNNNQVFPTLQFPSDHAAVAADLFLPSDKTEL
jgi:endonuclease/exonuclease/phosphatase family metal-dependent hydrolase